MLNGLPLLNMAVVVAICYAGLVVGSAFGAGLLVVKVAHIGSIACAAEATCALAVILCIGCFCISFGACSNNHNRNDNYKSITQSFHFKNQFFAA